DIREFICRAGVEKVTADIELFAVPVVPRKHIERRRRFADFRPPVYTRPCDGLCAGVEVHHIDFVRCERFIIAATLLPDHQADADAGYIPDATTPTERAEIAVR